MQLIMQLKYDVYIPNQVESALAPVILLHSMLENRKTWRKVAPEIMKLTYRKVYAIDARNCGESPWTAEYSIEAMTNDLEEFLLQNKIDKVVLVGHSIGGKVAIQYAFRKPHTVEKLIIEDSTPRNSVTSGDKVVNLALNLIKEINLIPRSKDKETALGFLKEVFLRFTAKFGATKDQIMKYDFDLLPFEWKGDSFILELNVNVLADAFINNKLQQNISGTFEGDVLLLYGKNSVYNIGSDDEILKYFPKTKKIGFENVGHFIHQIAPKEFTQEVVNFINKESIKKAKY